MQKVAFFPTESCKFLTKENVNVENFELCTKVSQTKKSFQSEFKSTINLEFCTFEKNFPAG